MRTTIVAITCLLSIGCGSSTNEPPRVIVDYDYPEWVMIGSAPRVGTERAFYAVAAMAAPVEIKRFIAEQGPVRFDDFAAAEERRYTAD